MSKEINNLETEFAFKGVKIHQLYNESKTHRKQKHVFLTCLSVKKKAILEGNFNNTEHVLLNFTAKFRGICPPGILIQPFINTDIKIDRMEHNCYLVAKKMWNLFACTV